MNKSRIPQEIAHLSGDPARKKQSGMVDRQDDIIRGINHMRLGYSHYAIIRFGYFAEQPAQSDGQTTGDDANVDTIRGRVH